MTRLNIITSHPKIGLKALEQEAKRVFRSLSETGAYIGRLGGHLTKQEEYGIFVPRNNRKKPTLKIQAAILAAFVANDWVSKKEQGQWWLTEQGAAWLRREIAEADPFRAQHQLVRTQDVEITETRKIRIPVNQGESPLGWLRYRKGAGGKPLLSQEQYDAGERIRMDFERAQMAPRITSDITRAMGASSSRRAGGPGTGVVLTESAMAAKERFFKALDAVGPDLSDVLVEVCCFVRGMEEAEKQLRLPQRSGKIVLQIALTRLGIHYGMIAPDKPRWSKNATLRQWGAEDFRPTI